MQIYDIRLKSYRTALEEFQPSWDGIVQTRRGPRGPATAAEYVARDLDDLNGHYEELVDALQRRLQLLCDMAQQELDEFEVMNDFFLFRILFSFSCSSRLSDIMMLLSVDCCWLLLVFPYPLSPSSLDQLVLAATFVC
jgi:hypothetical protein